MSHCGRDENFIVGESGSYQIYLGYGDVSVLTQVVNNLTHSLSSPNKRGSVVFPDN